MTGSTRRGFLQAVGGLSAAGLAGCTSTASPGEELTDGPSARASFFVVSDFTANVVGDTMAVEPLVPFGQHGHGWEPGPTIQRDVLDSDAFVYVGEGFQPWADKIVQNIRDDGADVHVVEAWADVDLLPAGEAHGDDHTETHDEAHAESQDEHSEDEHTETHEGEHSEDEHTETHEGEHSEDEHTETHEGEHTEGDGHDHTGRDPHFWLDPIRATQAVQTIAHGLEAVLPDQHDALQANAAAYSDRLDHLHHTFEDRLSGRTRDTVLFAGHNSFRYLGHRFGFHVASLSDLAPDDTPSPRDIADAQAIIDDHDIEYVLAPVFESDQAARQLVEQTDAIDVLPLTPVPTLTTAWADDGKDFVDVMTDVNLASLATALGAE